MEKEYSRYMSNFRGIDATSDSSNVSLNRFSFIQNMYKDYKSGQGVAIETFPGTRTLANFGDTINGIYTYRAVNEDKLYVVVHAGENLFRFAHDDRDKIDVDKSSIFSGMANACSQGFIFNNRLYIIDGEHYVVVDENGKARKMTEEDSYVPTTYSNGEQYEQRNMLTNKFIERQYISTMPINELSNSSSDSYKNQNIDNVGIICGINTYPLDKNYYYKTSMTVYPAFTNVKIDFLKLYSSYYHNFSSHGSSTASSGKKYLNTVKMYDTVNTIEGNFDGCANLTSLTLSNNIKNLSDRFFAGTGLSTIYLPAGLEVLGEDAFVACSKLTEIYCSDKMYEELTKYDDKEGFSGDKYGLVREIIENETPETEELEVTPEDETTRDQSETEEQVIYKVKLADGKIGSSKIKIMKYSENIMTGVPAIKTTASKSRIYIHTPCESIEKICIGNVEISNGAKITYIPFRQYINGKTYILAVDFYNSDEETINDYVYVYGKASPSKFSTNDKYIALLKNEEGALGEEDKSIFGDNPDYKGTAEEAITHCKIVCAYDDRIFLTGNPALPNTVFYTQRDLTGHNNPTYIGMLNYFNDGVGNTPNIAMMANSSMLMVLKGNTLQDGSIYYHTGGDGGNDMTPRIYPSIEGLAGLGCTGMAVNFRDDCVFMSNRGLEAIAKQTVNLERTIEHRSTNIDGLMLQSDLSSARAAEWEGYLCILIDGKMFLADSRQAFEGIGGALEYEWYYVDPVCGYDGDNKKYILADYMPSSIEETCKQNGIFISEADDRHVEYEDVRSIISDTDGKAVYYVEQDGVKYLVCSVEGELENGTPDKACEICAVEDVLLFGTEKGKLLCLNNDKRGMSEHGDDKNSIPVEWYNNSGHAYVSVAVLANENAGVPHYTKTTVKRGTILRLKAFPSSAFDVYATTDRQATTLLTRQSNSVTTFDNFDLENIGLLTTDSNILAIKEKTKKWVEKQYRIMSGEHNKPFGLYSITYRYTIAGEVKNR